MAYRVLGNAVQASVNGVPLGPAKVTVHSQPGPRRPGNRRDPAGVPGASGGPKPGTYVDASDGSSALTEVPRFGDPEKLAPAGSLLAPMPGLVRRVLVEVGAVVTAGQPLLVLEAMKMEQTVAAPAAGVVAELRAKAASRSPPARSWPWSTNKHSRNRRLTACLWTWPRSPRTWPPSPP